MSDGVFGTAFNKSEFAGQDSHSLTQGDCDSTMTKRLKQWALESSSMTGLKKSHCSNPERKGTVSGASGDVEPMRECISDCVVQDCRNKSDELEWLHVSPKPLPHGELVVPPMFHTSSHMYSLSARAGQSRKRKFNLAASWLDQHNPENDIHHSNGVILPSQQPTVESDYETMDHNKAMTPSLLAECAFSGGIAPPDTKLDNGTDDKRATRLAAVVDSSSGSTTVRHSLQPFPTSDVSGAVIGMLSVNVGDDQQKMQSEREEKEQRVVTTNTAVFLQHAEHQPRKQRNATCRYCGDTVLRVLSIQLWLCLVKTKAILCD